MTDIHTHKQEAYEKAIDSLARYKFMQFGYWSAIWVHLNQIDNNMEQNPFRSLVDTARNIQARDNGQLDILGAEYGGGN